MKGAPQTQIKIEKHTKYAIIRFSSPEIRNPLSSLTLTSLDKKFDELNSENGIGKIIFTGTGNTFASGADLNEIDDLTHETAVEFGLRGQNLMQKIKRSEKKTIAAINGYCMGGALDLAVSCDSRIAHPNAVFSHPGVRLGIITGWGGTQMLPRLIGEGHALDLFLTARSIDANEALRIGLIDEINQDPLAKSVTKD